MHVVDHAQAHWFLLEHDGALYLDANCSHGAFGYSWLICLDADEQRRYRDEGRAYLGELATAIHDSVPVAAQGHSPYRDRDQTRALSPQVSAAIAAWRAASAGEP